MTEFPITGGCQCGAVRIQVSEPFMGAVYCYCQRCQRRSGTTRSMTALSPPGSVSVIEGRDKIKVWDPGDGWLKAFCTECGSHTHTTSPDDPSIVATRMGCLDEDPGTRPTAHQFVNYASPLESLPDDGLPRFPERLGTTDAWYDKGARRIIPYFKSSDLGSTRDFYTGVLGLEEQRFGGDHIGFGSDRAQVVFAPTGMKDAMPRMGIDVGSRDAVDAAHARAIDAGREVTYRPVDEPWGVRRFFVRDPDGIEVSVLAHD